jgi:hypothetical protein
MEGRKQLALKNKKKKSYKSGLRLRLEYDTLDGRTSTAKAVKAIRNDLRGFVGESNAAAEILISRISYKVLKLTLYELTSLQNLKNDELPHYLPLSNSCRLDLIALAQLAGKPKPMDLNAYLEKNYANKDAKHYTSAE